MILHFEEKPVVHSRLISGWSLHQPLLYALLEGNQ